MKKTFRTLSVMALAGLVMLGSCKKNDENNNTNTNAGDGVLRAGIEQPTSNAKTSLDPTDGVINWTAGDQILVYGNNNNGTFTLIEGAESNYATFRCPQFPVEAQSSFRAAYPAGIATINDNEVIFNIPAEQTLTAMNTFGNGANPMVAYSTIEGMQFKSVFGGIGIKLTGTAAACHVTKLVLTDDNNWLCGQFKVADITAANPQAVYNNANGGHTITVNLPEGGVTVDNETSYNVYVMLPVGALNNGFTLTAYDGNYVVKTGTTTVENAAAAEVLYNTVKNEVVKFEAKLPAGQANTAAAVMAATSPVTVVSGTLDFAGLTSAEAPLTQKVTIAENANVEVKNLYATSNVTDDAPMVINSNATVVLDHVNLVSTKGSTGNNGAKGLNIAGHDANVTIKNSNIEASGASYPRGLQVELGENNVITVENSTISSSSHYAINIRSTAPNTTINLKNNSKINGWAALNIWGNNQKVYAENSELSGLNVTGYTATDDNDFGTIVYYGSNCEVELNHCQVKAESRVKAGQTHQNAQWAVLVQDYATGTDNRIIMRNGTTVTGITTGTAKPIYTGTYLENSWYYEGKTITRTLDSDTNITWDNTWN